MKILVLGHGGHGKGTVCEHLQLMYGFSHRSSSQEAYPIIKNLLDAALGDLIDHVKYRRLGNNRIVWKEAISLINHTDPAALCKILLKNYDVYDGMRTMREFEASKNLFDLILYVDAHKRKPSDPSMEIEYDPLIMHRIDNNGGIKLIEGQLEVLHKYQVRSGTPRWPRLRQDWCQP